MATLIHPTAVVEPGAELGVDCEILPYAIVTKHCVLGDGVVGHPFSVIGGDPQYLQFDRELKTGVKIGSGSVMREHVTVNRSIHEGESTVVGEKCFLMATSHVGHDCIVGDHVGMANGALLAGHVSVGSHTFMGGGSAVHQFCRIGESVMVAGLAAITRDVPPFIMVAERDDVIAFNNVGLRRRGYSREVLKELKSAYQGVFFAAGNIRTIAAELLSASAESSAEAQQFLEFFAGGTRGFVRARRKCESGVNNES
jgi:UDP-N-acetylglucosamine acyltransferase